MEHLLSKCPPNSREVEEALLASIFINPVCLDDIPWLSSEDFYQNTNRTIYGAMESLRATRQPVDSVTVAESLKKRGELSEIGGIAYLAKIMDAAPIAFDVVAYAEIIKKHSLSRQIIQAGTDIVQKAFSGVDGNDLLEVAQSCFMQIQPTTTGDKIHCVSDLIQRHIDHIEAANIRKEVRGYPTGFPSIDRCLSIIGPKLIVIAARPKMGKTSFVVTMSRNMDRAGVKVGFLSLEMAEGEILDRWLAQSSGVDSEKFGMYRGLSPDEWKALSKGASELSISKIIIDDSGSLSIEDVKRRCRKMVKAGVQVIFIDQLSQIRGRKNDDRFTRFANNVNELALLKKELGVPIILLAQLNRELEKRGNKEPMVSDLKMTGNLEEDADAVIFIYRPEVYAPEGEKEALRGHAIINLALNRHGSPWRENRVRFVPEKSFFYQIGDRYGEQM